MKEIALAQNFATCPNNVVSPGAKAFSEDGKCARSGAIVRLTHFPSKGGAMTFFFRDIVAIAPCQSSCSRIEKFQKVFAGRTKCSRGP